MKTLTTILTILVLTLTAFSQHVWVSNYSGPGINYDDATDIAADGLGNVYVTGISFSGIPLATGDYATIKYNSSGVQQWIQTYNGPGNDIDWAKSIAVDGSGNVYVTGYSRGNGTSNDFTTIKYNSAGVQQWVQRYNGPASNIDEATSLGLDAVGNVYVTGRSEGDCTTIKYNSSGIQQWVHRYNGPGNTSEGANSLAIDLMGNVYVTGDLSTGAGQNNYLTIKLNPAGVMQWVQTYNGPGNAMDWANSIAVDVSGNVFVTGYSTGLGTWADYATIKYNALGVQQWVQRYNEPGNGHDAATSIAVDGSGNVYVTGTSYDGGTADDFATIKYNSSGDSLWVRRYNGPANNFDGASSIVLDGSGNVYVTGLSNGAGTFEDFATVKYNSAGVQLWAVRYNGQGNSHDTPRSLALDAYGNIYVTGSSNYGGYNADFTTLKYSPLVGIQQLESEIPSQFSLSQNYPNPFNPSTTIRFSIPASSNVKLAVFNSAGQEVANLVNESMNAGTYEYRFDAGKLSSGVYFYKLITDNFTDTKKMMLVK